MTAVRLQMDKASIDRLFSSEDGPVAKIIGKKAVQVERQAKHLCPVDTGRLQNSITWAFGKDSKGVYAVVGSDVEYAPHVEFGTINMAAQPFLRPALQAIS